MSTKDQLRYTALHGFDHHAFNFCHQGAVDAAPSDSPESCYRRKTPAP
jgi:hypothetical protein